MILCLLYFNRIVPCRCVLTCRAPPTLWGNKDFYYYYYYYYYTLLLRCYTFLKCNVLLNNCTNNAFVNNHYNDVRSCIGDNLLHLKCRLNMP